MRRRSMIPLIAVASLLMPALAMAGEARALFDRFSQGLEGLEGRFEQHVYDADGRLTESSTGTIALRAPRQFRWEYSDPFPQLILADGDHVWIYDPDLEQANVRVQSYEEQSSPLAALIDPAELDRQFIVGEGGADADGLVWLSLQPRLDDGQFSQARLAFDAQAQLARMQLDDALGQRTEVGFSDWTRNPGFDAGFFRFQAPPGVDIVGEMAPGAEVFPVE